MASETKLADAHSLSDPKSSEDSVNPGELTFEQGVIS